MISALTLDEPLYQPFPMIAVLWNCRRARGSEFKLALKDMINKHKPNLIILTKRKMPESAAKRLMNELDFTNYASVVANGLSRGSLSYGIQIWRSSLLTS